VFSEREMTHDARENKTRSRGTLRNELHPNGVHDSDESVSPENARNTTNMTIKFNLYSIDLQFCYGEETSAGMKECTDL
jgi:hypothetical protein